MNPCLSRKQLGEGPVGIKEEKEGSQRGSGLEEKWNKDEAG